MVADMDYYRLVRTTDPSYTARDAIREYLSDNKELAIKICEYLGLEDMPFGFKELKDHLSGMDPVDILSLRIHCGRPFSFNGYFQFEGDGNLRSLDEQEYLSWCFSEACEHVDEIIDGLVPIPAEMNRVLDLWRGSPEDLDVLYNSKPSSKAPPKRKCAPKKTASKASVKKSAQRKVCSTKKAVSKNVKAKGTAKAPPKKPAPARKKASGRVV